MTTPSKTAQDDLKGVRTPPRPVSPQARPASGAHTGKASGGVTPKTSPLTPTFIQRALDRGEISHSSGAPAKHDRQGQSRGTAWVQIMRPTEQGNALRKIVAVVAAHTHVEEADIMGTTRIAKVAIARQICMYLALQITDLTQGEIGDYFHRDRATVTHAHRAISRDKASDPYRKVFIESMKSEAVVK